VIEIAPSCQDSDAVIRVCDAAGNVIETHEHKGDFKEWYAALNKSRHAVKT